MFYCRGSTFTSRRSRQRAVLCAAVKSMQLYSEHIRVAFRVVLSCWCNALLVVRAWLLCQQVNKSEIRGMLTDIDQEGASTVSYNDFVEMITPKVMARDPKVSRRLASCCFDCCSPLRPCQPIVGPDEFAFQSERSSDQYLTFILHAASILVLQIYPFPHQMKILTYHTSRDPCRNVELVTALLC